MRTPETLTATQRAERLRSEAGGMGQSTPPLEDMSKKTPLDRERASLMSGLNLDKKSASANLDPRTEVDGSFSILSIHDIVPYKYNPRKSRNPKYSEIKESIRADEITNALTVTRRPGEVKYFPYGGGNTRLEIAKELHNEGDSRFARLRVIIKAWKSEADVIAAHLAENENRGDTTFWEKALGVENFKREWESAHPGHVVIGAELNRHLKDAGINYGVRMIQNFAFAVEHLGPVGPWLRTEDLNTILRPSIGSYLDLAEKLDKREHAASQLHAVLVEHGSELLSLNEKNKQRDESERVPVELDARQLVSDGAAAIAQAIAVPTERMEAMAAALSERPRMSVKDLMNLEQESVSARSARSTPGRQDQGGERPNGADDSANSSPPDNDGESSAGRRPDFEQRPLGAMPGVIGGTAMPGHGAAHPGLGSLPHTTTEESRSQRRTRLHGEIRHLFEEINKIAPIFDAVLEVDEMPFGFMVEIPDSMARIGDIELDERTTRLRTSIWWLLTTLSGQVQDSVWARVRALPPVQATRWAQQQLQGSAAFQESLIAQVGAELAIYGPLAPGGTDFEVFLSGHAIWTVLAEPQLGPLVTRLIGVFSALRQLEPDRHETEARCLELG
ncbi:integrating conjugative element, PFGI_1 class, ParB family protein [Variovorax sp. HW608]|uniref:ParB family protein n=1 Tax=Variovorax sp. HW608 TaxID=1034889 RepID=UPI00081F8588|nr:ParB family protein [Variovorax sp. HW608]SCK55754.1 integrating conjugative element, PFGI_1 class, ParB family protein [Variovorax sp. HW608]